MRRLIVAAAAAALALPGSAAAACQPSPAHPSPVVLVHGTFANQEISWNALRPLLQSRGYCVYPVALQWVVNALGRAGPADPGFRPRC
jgi:triacylglycerol esterase/lipase EstA (alpha/beta hydrolase family)